MPDRDVSGAAAPRPSIPDIVDSWFAESFHGHPAIRDTETFNHLRASVDRLKARLVTPEEGH